MKEQEPYRPSNGTEGIWFCSEFCDRCIHEKWAHTMNDQDKKCDILSRSFLYEIGDPEYPKEWVYVDGKPTCTAWVKWDWGQDDEDNWIDPEPVEPDDPNQLCLPFIFDEIEKPVLELVNQPNQ